MDFREWVLLIFEFLFLIVNVAVGMIMGCVFGFYFVVGWSFCLMIIYVYWEKKRSELVYLCVIYVHS